MRWRGETVVVMASGPSLTAADATYAREHARRVIVINETWRLCPSADVLYGADHTWWAHRAPPPEAFLGERWTQQAQWPHPGPPAPLQVMQSKPGHRISPPGANVIETGSNSAYQGAGLAVVWGASRVVFLGLDLCAPDGEPNHWHGDHAPPCVNSRVAYPGFIKAFTAAAPRFAEHGVTVVNASRRTALTCFPRMTIQEALNVH